MPRIRLALLAAAFGLLVVAPAASAVTTATLSGNTLTVTSDPGDDNFIRIEYDSGTNNLIVEDNGPGIVDGGSCAEPGGSSTQVRCERPVTTVNVVVTSDDGDDEVVMNTFDTDDTADIDLGAGNDFGALAGADGSVSATPEDRLVGGTGNDVLFDGAPIFGGFLGTAQGPGDDTLLGGQGNDQLHASDGDDDLDGGSEDDTFTPGPGVDDYVGGTGTDAIDTSQGEGFGDPGAQKLVSLDDQANDGPAGAQVANVHSDVEDVTGDIDADTFRGSSGTSFMIAGRGDDDIDPGTGVDAVSGQEGNDTIQLHDSDPDAVRCGPGTDTVTVDMFDIVDGDCENVITPAADTSIDSGPAEGSTTSDNTPEFTFSSNEPSAKFQCSVDDEGFGICKSPYSQLLADGTHSFKVRALDSFSNIDRTPATRTFTVGLLPGTCTNTRETGTAASDTINGTRAGDDIRALAGNDKVNSLQGNDCVFGEAGNDRIAGGDDDDRLNGEAGRDNLSGDTGADRLSGGGERDTLSGGDGADRLSGGDARDKLDGGGSNDRLNGGDGNDVLTGGTGRDTLTGGDGNDTINGGKGPNSVSAGAGNDNISAANGRRERISCGSGTDTVRADDDDRLSGCEGVRRV